MATAAFSESAIDLAIRRAAEKLGYSKLRHQQVRAVKNFVQGNDVFVSLPTGSGKSLCYSILLASFDSLFGADGRHLARCTFLSHRDNQILYAFRVNYHYVTAYRTDPKTLAGAPRRNSPRDYVWFTRLGIDVFHASACSISSATLSSRTRSRISPSRCLRTSPVDCDNLEQAARDRKVTIDL